MIIDLDDDGPSVVGHDRRRAVALVFTLCLAVGSAFLGRDGPVAIPQARALDGPSRSESGPTMVSWSRTTALSLPANTTDVQFVVFPDWLANEQLPPMPFVPVRVRAASGLAVEAHRPGDQRMVTWTEGGTVYWLISDDRDIADLLRLADSLR